MVRRKHRLLSLLLSLMMFVSVVAAATVTNTSAASGDTVFCENAAGWSEVYCYMWNGDGQDCNSSWPGVKMTKGDGNLWSYTLTGNWSNIIFNNNSGQQTGDMTHQGNGSCYNNQSGGWSKLEVPDNPTEPTTPTTPTEPVTPTGKNVVYCKNDAGWGSVYVYMWTDGQGDNKGWPGVAATNIGDGVWMLEYEGDYKMIIFNNGSGTQTENISHPGTGQMYNNSTKQWSLYDPTQLHFKGLTADPASPQYTGVDIKLSISAGGGEGELSYKFTVTAGSNTTVLSDYSTESTCVWTPEKAGTYTVTYSVKDEAGNVKSDNAIYKINDINAEVKPVLKSVSVTPTNSDNSEIVKGKEAVVDISAGGGNTGTKLLFYKVKVTDPKGKTANVPYYTTGSQYKFTPTALGEYEIEVFVQNSDNTTVTRSYKYQCVSELSAPGALSLSVSKSGAQEVGSAVTVKATATGGTAPYTYQFKLNGEVVKDYSAENSYVCRIEAEGEFVFEVSVKDSTSVVTTKNTYFTVSPTVTPGEYLKGDSDCDGKVNIKDATAIQKHLADIIVLTAQGLKNAEVDSSGQLTVKDATMIQKHLAGIDVNW